MAGQRGVTFDTPGFEKAMEAQKAKARAGSAFGLAASGRAAFEAGTAGLRGTADRFEGYAATRVEGATVIAALDEDGQPTDGLAEGQTGYVALDRTPFYVESGGQVSDTGNARERRRRARAGARAGEGGRRTARACTASGSTAGELQPRDTVVAAVDDEARDATRRNHTATHLLHAALRQVLGSHVKQAGSLVVARPAAVRLRARLRARPPGSWSRWSRSSTSRSGRTRRSRPR